MIMSSLILTPPVLLQRALFLPVRNTPIILRQERAVPLCSLLNLLKKTEKFDPKRSNLKKFYSNFYQNKKDPRPKAKDPVKAGR